MEVLMAGRVEHGDPLFKRAAGAFAPFVAMNLKWPSAENEVDEDEFERLVLGVHFQDDFSDLIVSQDDFLCARVDSRTMTEARRESISAGGGTAQ